MKYLSLRLVNYKGCYNGLQVHNLYLDFSQAKNGMIVIAADNGKGKSTIMDALSPLYDDNSKFIDGVEAVKELVIQDNDIIYNISCIHGVNASGKRETGKAYLKKVFSDGTTEELNSNGNLTSFKEVLFNELNLDPNYIALSYLSSVHQGIGQKTASERKVLVNNLIRELVSYNNMYKVFAKRSSSFKAIINNITNKMNMIGDEEKVKLSLLSLENRINNLMETKDKYIEDMGVHKSKAKLLDPNGDIQNTYNNIYNSLLDINTKYDNLDKDIKKNIVSNLNLDENISVEELLSFNNSITNEYSDLEVTIRVEETSILNILNDREKDSKEIQEKIAKLDSIKIAMEFDDIDSIIQIESNNLNKIKEQIISMGLLNSDISKEEYIIGIETLNNIKEIISVFKSDCELHILEKAGDCIINNISLPSISDYDNSISKLNSIIQEDSIKYSSYMALRDTLSVLDNRPSNCNIDSCSFIQNAVINKQTLDNVDLDKLNEDIMINKATLVSLENEKIEVNELIRFVNLFNNIIRDIRLHANILKKLPIDSTMYTDTNKLVSLIINGYDFREIDDLYMNIHKAEYIELYKQSIERVSKLENQRQLYEGQIQIIDELTNNISNINEKLDKINSTLEETNRVISNAKVRLTKLNTLKMCFNSIFNMNNERKKLEEEKLRLLSTFNNIKNDMINIKSSLDGIKICSDNLESINNQIRPLLNDRDKLKFGITQLEEYKVELQEFNLNYEKVETFKKYSSPSKDGIQNLFIELYMHQTLKLTNDILSLLFDGEFVVGDFVLNDREFRIPVFGNGLPHDDISSMSNAQVSMIQMIISFVLLHQSSPKFNIVRLDELDSMLDTNNRLQFVYVLEKVREMLEVEQTFIISHNNEINLQEASIILLKYSQEIDESYDIIFDYRKHINESV